VPSLVYHVVGILCLDLCISYTSRYNLVKYGTFRSSFFSPQFAHHTEETDSFKHTSSINVSRSSCKLLFFSDFNQQRDIFLKYSKSPQLLNFMKIRPVGVAVLRQWGGRTGVTRLVIYFRSCFPKTPDKWSCLVLRHVMKAHKEVEIPHYAFLLITLLDGSD